MSTCDLCLTPGGDVLWQSPQLRVVQVDDADYPGFCRVIWQAHIKEMSDLAPEEAALVFRTVLAVERVLRRLYAPDKINLASFGNMTPHVHWHVIPRWQDDKHFPQPLWGTPQREAALRPGLPARDQLVAALRAELAE